MRQPEEGQVPHEPRARVHPELQSPTSLIQEDERRKGLNDDLNQSVTKIEAKTRLCTSYVGVYLPI